MLKIGMTVDTVKKQMKEKYKWWKISNLIKFESGEENLYYISCEDNSDMLVFFFDGNKRLGRIMRLDKQATIK